MAPPSTNATERRAGRRPSKDNWDDDDDMSAELSGDFAFGSCDNVIQKQEIKDKILAAKTAAAAKGDILESKRSLPERSLSSDSYEDYHKKVFENH